MDKRQTAGFAGLGGTVGRCCLAVNSTSSSELRTLSAQGCIASRLLEGINKLSGLVNGGLHITD